jgi:hypothetical protein
MTQMPLLLINLGHNLRTEKVVRSNIQHVLPFMVPVLVFKYQLTINTDRFISILSHSSHLEWRAGLSDTTLKGDHPVKFGSVLHVRQTDGRWTPSDGKGSHGLWPSELKRGCRGCDHMVVGFTTTCAISAYHH